MVDRFADGLNMKKDDFSTLHPIGRIGRVEEVANAVLWLCSAGVTNHRDRFLAALNIAITDDDLRAFASKRDRRRAADS